MSALTTIFPQLFQSHAGSIEAGLASLPRVGIEPTFQSHAGSIEAKAGLTGCQSPPWFQSHAGSIEAFSSGGDICYAQPLGGFLYAPGDQVLAPLTLRDAATLLAAWRVDSPKAAEAPQREEDGSLIPGIR